MSADNLISVYETNHGDFLVGMEFASVFWQVEYSYWELEEMAKKLRDEGKYAEPGDYGLYRTLEEADAAADRLLEEEYIVEYGIEVSTVEDRLRTLRAAREHRHAENLPLEWEDKLTERLALRRPALIT